MALVFSLLYLLVSSEHLIRLTVVCCSVARLALTELAVLLLVALVVVIVPVLGVDGVQRPQRLGHHLHQLLRTRSWRDGGACHGNHWLRILHGQYFTVLQLVSLISIAVLQNLSPEASSLRSPSLACLQPRWRPVLGLGLGGGQEVPHAEAGRGDQQHGGPHPRYCHPHWSQLTVPR